MNENYERLAKMKLLIATPFYETKGWSPYIRSLAASLRFLYKHTPIEVTYWEWSGDSYVDRARNGIAHLFMESDCTHLLFIDSDMEWSVEGLARLLAADVDVVGTGYPCKNLWDFYGCILHVDEKGVPQTNEKGLIKAWGMPTGFMLIKREVFQRLMEHEPENWYHGEDAMDKEAEVVKMYNFFGRIVPLGEDISFCRRWVAAGGELWVEPRVTIVHYGIKGYMGNYDGFLKQCPGGSHDPNRKLYIDYEGVPMECSREEYDAHQKRLAEQAGVA
jgi:hypothetical protein